MEFTNFDLFPNDGIPALPIQGDGNGFQTGGNFPQFDANMNQFAHEGPFMGPNDDLNSFFTPIRGIEGYANESTGIPQGQWENGAAVQMFNQQEEFPFPRQPPPQQMPMNNVQSNWLAPNPTGAPVEVQNPTAVVAVAEEPDIGEDQEKPKRGRPRKRKGKQLPTLEQEKKKRERFLERNRAAASKCRKRKKESTEHIIAKSQALEQNAAMLRGQLDEMRAFYVQCLGYVAEFAGRHSDCSDMRDHLQHAAGRGFVPQRMRNEIESNATVALLLTFPGGPEPTLFQPDAASDQGMSRTNSQQSDNSHRSVYSTATGLQPSSIEGECTTEQLHQERESIEAMDQVTYNHAQSHQFVGMEHERTLAMSREGSVASYQSAETCRGGSSTSYQSMTMSREGSYSSLGQTSNKDSGYGSNRTTPKEQKLPSPPAGNDGSAPTMMSNQRVPSQQIQSRKLRSGKVQPMGPSDLDDPSVHMERLANR